MSTIDRSEMNRGMRSVMNVLAISLFVAYVSAFFLVFFMPTFVVFFIPVVILYFVAPKLSKQVAVQPTDSSYKTGRWAGLAIGLAVGVAGLVYGLGPVFNAVNSGTAVDSSSIATPAITALANAMYLVAFLVGYFRGK